MIVTKTPLRIGFFSGGSDMPTFYREHGPGYALSATIDKYVYATIHPTRHDPGVTLLYPTTNEKSVTLEEIRHSITREALKHYHIPSGITVSSVSDVPSYGTGLGSSSAFTVGLINAIEFMKGYEQFRDTKLYWREQLAEKACEIEIDRCGHPIGKQDQYAAACGGLNFYTFNCDDTVEIERLYLPQGVMHDFKASLVLFYTGRGHSANAILKQQTAAISDKKKFKLIDDNRRRALVGRDLLKGGHIREFGGLLHEAWMAKKQVVEGISSDYFDEVYSTGIRSGAWGGKLLGAGGGGFMLFCVDPTREHELVTRLCDSFSDVVHYPFSFVFRGTSITTHC
jgi:D-glycero-alpha-D-manno-heptose-7-phosphate kinase